MTTAPVPGPGRPSRRPGGAPRRGAPPGGDGGQATVELALLLPALVLLLLTVIQVGLVCRDALLVAHAAREAARAAAADPDPGAARAAAHAAGGLDPDRLEVTTSGRAGPGSRVVVEVRYRAPTDVPLVGALVGERELVSRVTMRTEVPHPGGVVQ